MLTLFEQTQLLFDGATHTGRQVVGRSAMQNAGKSPLDWSWLLGYLAQKAAAAAMAGDLEKAKHHTISSAAVVLNWHRHLTGEPTVMRPGIDPVARGVEAGS